jgi:hypothetical protein
VSGEFNVRRLRVEDVASLVSLRREALEADPLAFGASVDDDRGLSLELVRTSLADHEEQAVFGCLKGVTETASTAKRLYERAGFRSWGREPRALHWKGHFVDEDHLVLEL